jgi:hypothetical protein
MHPTDTNLDGQAAKGETGDDCSGVDVRPRLLSQTAEHAILAVSSLLFAASMTLTINLVRCHVGDRRAADASGWTMSMARMRSQNGSIT